MYVLQNIFVFALKISKYILDFSKGGQMSERLASLGIMGDEFRVPLNPLDTIVL